MGGTVCSTTACGDDVGRRCDCAPPAEISGWHPSPTPACDLCGDQPLGGKLLDHGNGNKRPPKYCLRLDNIGGVIWGAATFSCESDSHPDADVDWWYDGQGGITITGTVYGGKDGGLAWVDPELWTIEAHYQDLSCCKIYGRKKNDLCKKNDVNGYLKVTRVADGEVYEFTPKIKNGESLLIGDGHRLESGLSLWGWFMETPDARSGTQDWLAKVTCAPKPSPPPPCDCTEDERTEDWENAGQPGDQVFNTACLTVSAPSSQFGKPMLFDSDCSGAGCSGNDPDLAAQRGNVMIISEDNNANDPDDATRGTMFIDFAFPADVSSITIIDIESKGDLEIVFRDASNAIIATVIPDAVGDGGVGDVAVSVSGVARIEFVFETSGAIDTIVYTFVCGSTPPPPTPPPPLPIACCIQDVSVQRCENNGGFANNGACCIEASDENECQTRHGGELVSNCYACSGPSSPPPPSPPPAELFCCQAGTDPATCQTAANCRDMEGSTACVSDMCAPGWEGELCSCSSPPPPPSPSPPPPSPSPPPPSPPPPSPSPPPPSPTPAPTPAPEVCEPFTRAPQGGFLLTHLGGGEAPPAYCLRLDDFLDLGKPVTFECDGSNGASVEWYHDGAGTLTISGQVYGGKDIGTSWDSPQIWNIYAVYTGIVADGAGFSTSTTSIVLWIWDDNESYEYSAVLRSGTSLDATLGFRASADPRANTLFTIEGWLDGPFTETSSTARDWIGLLDCNSTVDEPEDPFENWCCTCSEFGIDRQCFADLILDPSGGACGEHGTLTCAPIDLCDDCQGQDPAECRPFNGTAQGGFMLTHAGGSNSPPDYCLRLDDFDGNMDTYSFECDDTSGLAGGASVEWYYDGVDRLVIAGQIYGGVETGNVWTSPKLWNIYAVYTGVAPVAGIADATSAVIADAVVVYVWDNAQTFEYEGRSGAGAAGLAMIARVDERTNLEPRAAEHYTVTGFLTRLDQNVFGGAWLGLLDCNRTIDEPEDPFRHWCCDCPNSGLQRECVDSLIDPSGGACGMSNALVCAEVDSCDDCTPYSECVTDDDCDPCGVCSPQGMCQTDDSLRDPCGKCPGQSGFGDCNVVKCNAAFTGCLVTKNINVPEALADIEARIETLEAELP